MRFLIEIFLSLFVVRYCDGRKKVSRNTATTHPTLGVDPKRATCDQIPSPKSKVQFPDNLAGRSIASRMEMYTGSC
jgi:hypothetical protein